MKTTWDLFTIIQHAFDAGRNGVSRETYKPPAAQFENVSAVLRLFDSVEGDRAKKSERLDTAAEEAIRMMKDLGFTFDAGTEKWIVTSLGVTYSSMHEALRVIRDKATNNEEMSARCRCHAESARWHEIVTMADRAVNGAVDNTNDVGKLLAALRDIEQKASRALAMEVIPFGTLHDTMQEIQRIAKR